MARAKIKRKSTLIDMTAMSDVTVLLLTFFMLTSTFLSKEPVTVVTPSSVQEEKVPMEDWAQVLVSPSGEVFLSITGAADPDAAYKAEKVEGEKEDPERKKELQGTWASEGIRLSVLDWVLDRYNQGHPSAPVKLTEAQRNKFAKLTAIGVPIKDLPRFLNLTELQQDQLFTQFYKMTPEQQAAWNANPNNIHVGIPINDNKDLQNLTKINDFQLWMQGLTQTSNPELNSAVKRGDAIAVKADQGTDFKTMHPVIDNLQTVKLTRMKLMTALKSR